MRGSVLPAVPEAIKQPAVRQKRQALGCQVTGAALCLGEKDFLKVYSTISA